MRGSNNPEQVQPVAEIEMLETVKCMPEEADIFTEVLSEKVVHKRVAPVV